MQRTPSSRWGWAPSLWSPLAWLLVALGLAVTSPPLVGSEQHVHPVVLCSMATVKSPACQAAGRRRRGGQNSQKTLAPVSEDCS